jgi:hypothetical protein
MQIRSIAWSLLLSLISAPAFAQIYDVWERPRNAVELPIAAPTTVEIYLPRQDLYAVPYNFDATLLAGPIAGGIAGWKQDKRNSRQDEVAASLQAQMPSVDYGVLLQQAFEKYIGPAQFAVIKRVTVHHGTPAEIKKATGDDPTEQTLALVVRYYLGPSLCDLRISMSARLGPRSVVTNAPGTTAPVFSQILAYDVPGGCGAIAHEAKQTQFWTAMGPTAISEHLRAGMDGVMVALSHALATAPRFGRIPGKPIGWGEGLYSNSVGVVEKRIDDRVLVRLRNGLLVSLPISDRRVRIETGVVDAPRASP